MQRALYIAALTASACTQSMELETHRAIEPGTFRLVVHDATPHEYVGIDVAADGTFTGHGSAPWACSGRVTAEQLREVADLLEETDFLDLPARVPEMRCSSVDYRVRVEILSGPDAGLTHEIIAEEDLCSRTPHPIGRVVRWAYTRIEEARVAGACAGCPIEPALDPCVDLEPGDARACVDGEWQDCTDATAGALTACRYRPPLQCVPPYGFIPPLRWTAVAARLRRGPVSDGEAHVSFEVDVDVENGGAVPIDLPSSPMPFVELRDGAGILITGWPIGPHAGVLVSAPPGRATVTLAVTDGAIPGMRILTMTEATVSLRELPWPDAPFATPIPVEITDVTP